MNQSSAIRVAAVSGFLAVALGALGAHGLKHLLEQNLTVAIWEKAVFYHFIHTVMLFILATRPRWAAGPWWAFLAGIVLFSGSLYLLAVMKVPWIVWITPVGGVCFLVGWLWLAAKPWLTSGLDR